MTRAASDRPRGCRGRCGSTDDTEAMVATDPRVAAVTQSRAPRSAPHATGESSRREVSGSLSAVTTCGRPTKLSHQLTAAARGTHFLPAARTSWSARRCWRPWAGSTPRYAAPGSWTCEPGRVAAGRVDSPARAAAFCGDELGPRSRPSTASSDYYRWSRDRWNWRQMPYGAEREKRQLPRTATRDSQQLDRSRHGARAREPGRGARGDVVSTREAPTT